MKLLKPIQFLCLLLLAVIVLLFATGDLYAANPQRVIVRNGLFNRQRLNVNVGFNQQRFIAPQAVVVRNGLFGNGLFARRSLNINIGGGQALIAPQSIVYNHGIVPQQIRFVRSQNVYLTQPLLQQRIYAQPIVQQIVQQPVQYIRQPQQVVQYVRQPQQYVQHPQQYVQQPQAVEACEPQAVPSPTDQIEPDVQYQTAPVQRIVAQPIAVTTRQYYVAQPQRVRQFITNGHCQ